MGVSVVEAGSILALGDSPALSESTATIEARLAFGLGVERDITLSDVIGYPHRHFSDVARVVSLSDSGPAIALERNGLLRFWATNRGASGRSAPSLLRSGGNIHRTVHASMMKSKAVDDARCLTGRLLHASAKLDSTSFSELHRLRALIASEAYKWIAHATDSLERR